MIEKLNRTSLLAAKRKNFVAYRESFARGETVPRHFPVELYVEVNGGCNIGCIFCGQHLEPDNPDYKGNLSLEQFRRLEPFFEKAAILNAFGFGEPLLNKSFGEMLRFAGPYGMFIQFFTNGMLLDEQTAEICMEAGVGRIFFSVNAIDRKKYEEIHLRSSYDKVVENIRRIADMKAANGGRGPELAINFVLFEKNYEELEGVVRFAGDNGISTVTTKPLMVKQENIKSWIRSYDPERDAGYVSKAAAAAREAGVTLDMGAFLNSANAEEVQHAFYSCYQPFRTFYVDCRGDVRPCCFSFLFSLGNISAESPEAIWFGGKYKKLREQMFAMEEREECGECRKAGLNNRTDRIILEIDKFIMGPRSEGKVQENGGADVGGLLYFQGEDLKFLLGGRLDQFERHFAEVVGETRERLDGLGKWRESHDSRMNEAARLLEEIASNQKKILLRQEEIERYLNSRIELLYERELFTRTKALSVYDSKIFKLYRLITGFLGRGDGKA